MKRCVGPCGREKPLTAFYRRSAAPDGRQNCCKDCTERKRRGGKRRARQVVCRRPAGPALALLERMGREEGGKRAVARLMAERFGRTWDAWERTMLRWEATGKMSERDADRFACATGHHMDELWASERGAA